MYCMNCGATLGPGSGFCMSCGTPVTQGAPASQPMPPPPSMPPPGPYPAAPYPAPYAVPRPSGGQNVAVLAIVIVVILFLVGGALAWLFIGGSEQLGACVEEWQYQSPTRKENWTRAECQAFCDGPVNDGVHLACYFDPY